MLWVSVPWGLTPVHLLELQDVTPLLRYQFSRGVRLLGRGDLAPALATVDQLSEVAAAQRDRYASALALVLRADVLRRMARGEESLDAIRRALHWLEQRVSGCPLRRRSRCLSRGRCSLRSASRGEGRGHVRLRPRGVS